MEKCSKKEQESLELKKLGDLLSDEQQLHIIGGSENIEGVEDDLIINLGCKRWADCKRICVPTTK